MSDKPITIDEALADAKATLAIYTDSPLSKWVVDTFGEAQPCGQPEPEVHPGIVIITRDMTGEYTPDAACAVAAMLVRAAEEARKRAG